MKTKKTKWIWYVLAAIYILSPVDIIPDVIPGLGELDDVVVLLTLLAKISSDMGITDAIRAKISGSPISSKKANTGASKKVLDAEIVE